MQREPQSERLCNCRQHLAVSAVWTSSVQCSNFVMFNNNRDYETKVNLPSPVI